GTSARGSATGIGVSSVTAGSPSRVQHGWRAGTHGPTPGRAHSDHLRVGNYRAETTVNPADRRLGRGSPAPTRSTAEPGHGRRTAALVHDARTSDRHFTQEGFTILFP